MLKPHERLKKKEKKSAYGDTNGMSTQGQVLMKEISKGVQSYR